MDGRRRKIPGTFSFHGMECMEPEEQSSLKSVVQPASSSCCTIMDKTGALLS